MKKLHNSQVYLPVADESIWVGLLRLHVHIHHSRSLKDRRKVVTSIRDRLRARRNVSVAEVGHIDRPTDAIVAICMVGNDARFLTSSLDTLAHEIHGWYPGMIQGNSTRVFRPSSPVSPTGYSEFDG